MKAMGKAVLSALLLFGPVGCTAIGKAANVTYGIVTAPLWAPILLGTQLPPVLEAKRNRKKKLHGMPLKKMFPDKRARALAKAAGKGRIQQMDELVAQGVDVNVQGAKGATPLFWALREGNFEGYARLLELGADPNVVYDTVVLSEEGEERIRIDEETSIMHWAAGHPDRRFMEAALEYGGDPNLRAGWRKRTVIFETIIWPVPYFDEDRPDLVRAMEERRLLLLESGADINAVEEFDAPHGGLTPLLLAARIADYGSVHQLLELGADYQRLDNQGNSLMTIMAEDEVFWFSLDSKDAMRKVAGWLSERGVAIDESLVACWKWVREEDGERKVCNAKARGEPLPAPPEAPVPAASKPPWQPRSQ